MKRLLPILGIVAALLLVAAPAFAAEDHACDHTGTTIESLHHCVMHAYDMGHITNKGVANSLLAKLDAAQAALTEASQAWQSTCCAPSSTKSTPRLASTSWRNTPVHLVEHAQNVITALGG